MSIRSSSDKQRNSLKMAFRVSVEHGGGGKAIAEITRVNPPILSIYAAAHEEDRFAGIDIALDVDLAVGEPINARALAAAQGYDLVRIVDVGPSEKLGLTDLSRVIGATHEVEQHILDTLSDGVVTANEKLGLKGDIAKLRSVLNRLDAAVDAS